MERTPEAGGVLRAIAPANVAVAEVFGDVDHAWLFPVEAASVRLAVEQRRREFATTRHCARQALAQLGLVPGLPVPVGRGRAPLWPTGVAGSLTHCAGYRAAAVARTEDLAAVGIDAEPNAPLPEEVYDEIALPDERRHVTGLFLAHPGLPWDRLLFSAKESVYKVWYPLMGEWLDFHEASVRFDVASGTFLARLARPYALPGACAQDVTGRWAACEALVVTMAWAPGVLARARSDC